MTTGVVIGLERELMPNLALQANYTYSKSSDYVGLTGAADVFGMTFIPWRGLTVADYTQNGTLTSTLQDGTPYSVPPTRPTRASSPPMATGASCAILRVTAPATTALRFLSSSGCPIAG